MTTSTAVREPAALQVHIGKGVLLPLDEVLLRMQHLAPLERRVLTLRMGRRIDHEGHGQTVDQAAAIIGIPRERVRAIESLAWSKLRHPATAGAVTRTRGG
jgi:DNA-directed RNA polymerase sigma subunit (sigma70/sigma32)